MPAWNPASKNKAKIKQNPLNLQSVKCEYHCSYDVGIYISWVTTKEIIFHLIWLLNISIIFPLDVFCFFFYDVTTFFLMGVLCTFWIVIPCQCRNLSFSWECFLFPLYIMLFLCQDTFSKSHLVLQGPEQATDGKQSAGSSPSSCLTVVFTGAYALSFNRTESCSDLGNEIEQLTYKVF